MSAYIRSLTQMGSRSNVEELKPWADKLGQFLVNFGGLEFATHKYIAMLDADDADPDRVYDWHLAERIKYVIELLTQRRDVDDKGRQLAIRDWNEVLKMCEWRNHIAHNPVLSYWGWDKNPASDPPDGISIPDLRQLRHGGGVELTLPVLEELVTVSANLSRRLVETANALLRND